MKVIDGIFLSKISGGNSGLGAASSGLTNQKGSSIAQGIVSGRQNQGSKSNSGSSKSERGGGKNH